MVVQIWMLVTITQMLQRMMVVVIILRIVMIVMVGVHVKLTVPMSAVEMQ